MNELHHSRYTLLGFIIKKAQVFTTCALMLAFMESDWIICSLLPVLQLQLQQTYQPSGCYQHR